MRLVLPFGYTIDLSGIPQFFANADAQSYTTSAGAVRNASDRMPNAAGKTEQQSSDNPTNSETEGLPTARPAADSGLDFWELLKANLFYIWLAGAIVSLCWYATAYIVFSRKILHSFTAPHEEDLAVFQKMSRGGKVRLACSRQIHTPMLMLVFHPVVVLPQFSYTANGMENELYGLLRHELTHYCRHDIVYKWLVVFVTSLHWFNPFVYLIRREIGNACELSCDEAVIANMSLSERKNYGNTLLTLASKHRIPKGVMATTLCEGKKQLKGRLINIMNYKKKSHAAIILMTVLALLLVGCAAGHATLGGGETKVNNGDNSSAPQEEQSENSEALKAVLQRNTDFFSIDANKNLNINQLSQAVSNDSSVTAEATKFAFLDLDNDGTPEVVLWLTVNGNDDYGFEILRYQNGVVYGYTLSYRAFMNLKADGTFSFSSGAADSGFGTVKFTEKNYSIDEVTYSKSDYDSNNNMSISYFVDHKSATENAFRSALDRQSEKADAAWYNFTNENIEAKICTDYNTGTLIGAADNQKGYYGEWVVQKVLACGIGTYSSDEAEKLVGESLTFSADEASIFTDQPSDAAVIIDSPEYQETTESKDGFQSDYRMSFDTLGISTDSISLVQVTGSDGVSGTLLIKDSNTMILIAGGTYFELVKR